MDVDQVKDFLADIDMAVTEIAEFADDREAQQNLRNYVAVETFRNLDHAAPMLSYKLNETYTQVENHIKYTEDMRKQIVAQVVNTLNSCNFTCIATCMSVTAGRSWSDHDFYLCGRECECNPRGESYAEFPEVSDALAMAIIDVKLKVAYFFIEPR